MPEILSKNLNLWILGKKSEKYVWKEKLEKKLEKKVERGWILLKNLKKKEKNLIESLSENKKFTNVEKRFKRKT